jgi:hypothetical protein
MPPAIVAPGPLIEPPRAGKLFVVSYSSVVLTSSSTLPSLLSCARK